MSFEKFEWRILRQPRSRRARATSPADRRMQRRSSGRDRTRLLLPHLERIQPPLRLGATVANWNFAAELRGDARPSSKCDWWVQVREGCHHLRDIRRPARERPGEAETLAPPV